MRRGNETMASWARRTLRDALSVDGPDQFHVEDLSTILADTQNSGAPENDGSIDEKIWYAVRDARDSMRRHLVEIEEVDNKMNIALAMLVKKK
jgi:hypothetical protein